MEVIKMARLDDKVAIVTGGASGIGYRIVQSFKHEGATIIAADVNEEALEKLNEDKVHGMKLDVSSEEGWEKLVKDVDEKFGKIDILVNNAGITSEKPIDQITYNDWEPLSKINGFGTMLGLKYVGSYMKKQQKGSIVNLSSVTAQVGMGLNSYSASKGSVRAISKAAASEFGHAGVRVNAVFPGIIRTPMSEGLESSSETLAQIEAMTPLQRIGEPEEVANAILFLASDEASFITGAELAIDGGYSAR